MKVEMEKFWQLLNEAGWQGYIWRVSAKEAIVYKLPTESGIIKNETSEIYNRIQEANFYNKDKQLSLHVKNIDGKELAYCYKIEGYTEDKGFKLDKVSIDVPGAKPEFINLLKFRNLYQKQGSQISGDDYMSWIQVAQIFVGFKNQ